MKTSRNFSAIIAIAAFGVTACASTPAPIIGAAASQPRNDLGQGLYAQTRLAAYALRPSDQISVNVFREPDLSLAEVRLGVNGAVSLPLLGTIPAAGMTSRELEQDITKRLLAAGLRSPMVSVNIANYASHLVTVEGSVEDPGVYTFQPGSRLSSAIAMGGGPTRTANTEQVAVFRESPDGVMVALFDYDQMRQGTMLDPILAPGDRVVMGTDGLAVFYQELLRTLPALAVFATVALDNN
ncbi:polysaccharide biosynthesis/export family protein [uncultured Erythrobacter sp.]|uniref:polysaccharide biosynthesis/export family protein n=1 Tax=uncultured Erythrobacter sp. TaxID=263913 RepID=UPI00260DC06E|nr:polysaccharide biosynthesis/export family protein [uncultured Erythrobacter sp.]